MSVTSAVAVARAEAEAVAATDARARFEVGVGLCLGPGSGAEDELNRQLAAAGVRLAAPVVVAEEPGDMLRAVLEGVLRSVPVGERERVPVVLAAAEACAHAATRYAVRWTDTARRLRPSDSVALETSELVRGLGGELGWCGPLYLLVAPGVAGPQALLTAAALARGGRPAVVAELIPAPGGRTRPAPVRRGQAVPGVPEPEWLAVAALWPADLAPVPPLAVAAGLPGVLLPLAGVVR